MVVLESRKSESPGLRATAAVYPRSPPTGFTDPALSNVVAYAKKSPSEKVRVPPHEAPDSVVFASFSNGGVYRVNAGD